MKLKNLALLLLLVAICAHGKANSSVDSTKVPLLYSVAPLEFTEAFTSRTSPNTIRIPFRWIGRLVAVQARIDTVEGTFFFDTGAERLLLNERYFERDFKSQDVVSYGATGTVQGRGAKRIDTLRWDNLIFPQLMASILNLSHLESKRNTRVVGILGYDVFKDYEIFLDYPFRQLVLSKLDRKGERLDADAYGEIPIDSIDFKMARHGILIEAQVQGIPMRFNLDSGAELNLLDRKVNRKVLDNFKILKRVVLMGAGNREIETLAGILSGVKCGKQPAGSMRTLLASMDDLNRTFGTRLDGVMGFEFLRPRRTLINYKKKKLYFFDMVKP